MIKKLWLIVCSCLYLAACQSYNCDATKLDAWRIRVETQKESNRKEDTLLDKINIAPKLICEF